MSEPDFDRTLLAAAFTIAADHGWAHVNITGAARAAGLPLAEARMRFPGKRALLTRFGALLDQAALAAASGDGTVREQLFDLLMGRFEAMKPYRAGVSALMRALPGEPGTAVALACGTQRSMRWMLHAAGEAATGPRGALQVHGLAAVWAWTLRTFETDESEDLSATMSALDKALGRADRMARFLSGDRGEVAADG